MNIIKHKFFFITLSALLVVASIVTIAVKGLDFGIEFTGGTITEISYEAPVTIDQVNGALGAFDFQAQAQPFGEDGFLIRSRELSEADRGVMLASLDFGEGLTPSIERLNTVGPSIGKELRSKSIFALGLVVMSIILFIAFVFRHVSKPVSSWKYGGIAAIALVHDVIIPLGIFALLDKNITTLFVVGILSILGLSVNDTIVVFDRIRENILGVKEDKRYEQFDETVNTSLVQTMARSINTSVTLMVVLIVLWFVGPVATRDLALVLFIGMAVGTYSSIFLASPLLVAWKGEDTSKEEE
jgi:preprotein translocase subunit SecF